MDRLSITFAAVLSGTALGGLLMAYPAKTPAVEKLAPPSKARKTQTGLASYYSRRLDGKKTASGERFSNEQLVAAHRTYPLGTRVRVTNLKNGKSVVVRINDRGASAENHREGVIIDLSQAAATHLDMKKEGRVRVRVSVLEWGESDHPALVDVRETG
jgi:rare lipoprotein A